MFLRKAPPRINETKPEKLVKGINKTTNKRSKTETKSRQKEKCKKKKDIQYITINSFLCAFYSIFRSQPVSLVLETFDAQFPFFTPEEYARSRYIRLPLLHSST